MFAWSSPFEKAFKITQIVLGGIFLVSLSTTGLGVPLGPLLLFSVFAFLMHFVQVDISVADSQKTYFFWDVVFYAVVFLLYPMAAVACIIFASGFAYELWRVCQARFIRGRTINRDAVLYNFANPFVNVLYVPFVVATYRSISNGEGLLEGPHNLLALGASVGVFLLVATSIDTLYSVVRGDYDLKQLGRLWKSTYASILLHLAMLAPLGIVLAKLYMHGSMACFLVAIPVVVAQQAIKARRDVLRDTEVVIEAMVGVLEERDQYTFGHSERVSMFAQAIAEEMGLSEPQIQQVRLAGRIHDIGKIDVPDAVLRKPGSLNPEELVKMKSHTDRNYWYLGKYTRLGRHIPFELAAYHHERYDGNGYILGLKGEEIPLGSRIISVADTYDAMTSDRPYRKGLPTEEAMRRLQDAAGTQLDPNVVAAFVRLHLKGNIDTLNHGWKAREKERTAPGSLANQSPN